MKACIGHFLHILYLSSWKCIECLKYVECIWIKDGLFYPKKAKTKIVDEWKYKEYIVYLLIGNLFPYFKPVFVSLSLLFIDCIFDESCMLPLALIRIFSRLSDLPSFLLPQSDLLLNLFLFIYLSPTSCTWIDSLSIHLTEIHYLTLFSWSRTGIRY